MVLCSALCSAIVSADAARAMGGDDAFWNLWVVSVDSGKAKRITGGDGRFGEWHPAWSPDGQSIAYTKWGDGQTRVNLVRPDGSDDRTIASKSNDQWPDWSPDSRHLVISRGKWIQAKDRWLSDLLEITPDGREGRYLTHGHVWKWSPSWSQDGRTIVYINEAQGGTIYRTDVRTGRRTRIACCAESLDLAPNGRTIALSMNRITYLMNIDGTARKRIGEGYDPDWSPDGMRLAVADLDKIVVMNASGKHRRVITRSSSRLGWESRDPTWSPDGLRIAFSRN
jgi:Tol biopolymer transport system component